MEGVRRAHGESGRGMDRGKRGRDGNRSMERIEKHDKNGRCDDGG